MEIANKKFLIIYPNFPTSNIINQEYSDPLGPLHLCTYLQSKGIKCLFLNCVLEPNWEEYLEKNLDETGLVGFSAMTDQLPSTLKIARFIKAKKPDLPVIIGQVHATLLPEQCLKSNLFDFALTGGRGELSLEKLINFLFHQKGRLEDIPHLVYKNNDGEIVPSSAPAETFNFEAMPPIDYSLLGEKTYPNLGQYMVGVLSSRGCPYGCAFCINSVVPENRKWQAWSAERTIRELKHLTALGAKDIIFWDDLFFVNRNRVEKLLDLLEKEKIKIRWFANIRADQINEKNVSEAFLKRLESDGLTWVSIGAESGSQKMLDLMNKGIKVEDLINAAKVIGKTKIICTFSFMIGLPGEDRQDIAATLVMMRKVQELCPQAKFAGPQLYRPYPGSKFYEMCLASGWQPPQTLEEWAEKIESGTMETDPFFMPWVKDKDFTRTAWFYSIFLALPLPKLINHFRNFCRNNKKGLVFTIFGVLGVFLITLLGRLRRLLNFHKLHYEITYLKKYRAALSA